MNHVKALVKDLLLEKLFSKHNKNTMENVIFDELSKEEKIQFDNLIKKARENAINILKK